MIQRALDILFKTNVAILQNKKEKRLKDLKIAPSHIFVLVIFSSDNGKKIPFCILFCGKVG